MTTIRMVSPPSRLRAPVLILALVTLLTVSGCSRADSDDTAAGTGDATATAPEVRLGYFPNVTHAPALIGAEAGLFTAELGATKLTTHAALAHRRTQRRAAVAAGRGRPVCAAGPGG